MPKRKTTAPLIGGQIPAITQLRDLIRESGTPLTKLARESGTSYESLWKFSTGRQKTYNLLDAERIFYTLTGKTFMPLETSTTEL